MQKYTSVLFLSAMLLCLLTSERTTAQNDKSLNESWKDLKKSFHPDKNFIMPFSDSTNEDLQAFLFAVRETKGVKNAWIKMDNQKVVVVVEAKGSMVSVWNNLDKEMVNRYTVTDRTPGGFILADKYQSNTVQNTSADHTARTNTAADKKSAGTSPVYEQASQDAQQNYNTKDTGKHKSIWDQQKDYAEQMRQKNKAMENEVYSKNNNLFYNNPKDYVTEAPKEKGEWYVEYTLNGKKVTMYLSNEKLFTHSAGKNVREIHCHFLTPKPYKLFDLSITDPAYYPDVKKFEFGKPAVYSKMFKAMYVTPNVPTDEHALVEFHFGLNFSEGNAQDDQYHVYTFTGQEEKTGKKLSSNIQSGYFEILYFESRENGILEAKFAFTAKDVPCGWGGKKKDIVVTDGRLRMRLDNL